MSNPQRNRNNQVVTKPETEIRTTDIKPKQQELIENCGNCKYLVYGNMCNLNPPIAGNQSFMFPVIQTGWVCGQYKPRG